MFHSINNFDKFLKEFRKHCDDLALVYWTDAIFVMNWEGLAKPGTEKRFRFGLLGWVTRMVIGIAIASSRSGNERDEAQFTAEQDFNFRLLPTPAHTDSLSPIIEEIENRRYLPDGRGTDTVAISNACGLNRSFSSLSPFTSLRALFRSVALVWKIKRIIADIPSDTPAGLIPGFTPRLAEEFLRYEIELQMLERRKCRHLAIFLTYELSPESKAFVRWARKADARVIHVMHGQRLPTYQITEATDLVLFSKVEESWFCERVDRAANIWTIGHPRLEMIRHKVPPPLEWDSKRLPRISFFSQPSEGGYDRELRLSDWATLTGLSARPEVRLRLHPRQSRKIAMEDIKALGLDFVQLSDAGLQEDLEWCDAIASSWSTVSMEAAACGRGVFWTCSTPEKYEASQELRDHGIGALIRSSDEWEQYLTDWSRGSWSAPVVLPETSLRKLGMIGDSQTPWTERLGIGTPTIKTTVSHHA